MATTPVSADVISAQFKKYRTAGVVLAATTKKPTVIIDRIKEDGKQKPPILYSILTDSTDIFTVAQLKYIFTKLTKEQFENSLPSILPEECGKAAFLPFLFANSQNPEKVLQALAELGYTESISNYKTPDGGNALHFLASQTSNGKRSISTKDIMSAVVPNRQNNPIAAWLLLSQSDKNLDTPIHIAAKNMNLSFMEEAVFTTPELNSSWTTPNIDGELPLSIVVKNLNVLSQAKEDELCALVKKLFKHTPNDEFHKIISEAIISASLHGCEATSKALIGLAKQRGISNLDDVVMHAQISMNKNTIEFLNNYGYLQDSSHDLDRAALRHAAFSCNRNMHSLIHGFITSDLSINDDDGPYQNIYVDLGLFDTTQVNRLLEYALENESPKITEALCMKLKIINPDFSTNKFSRLCECAVKSKNPLMLNCALQLINKENGKNAENIPDTPEGKQTALLIARDLTQTICKVIKLHNTKSKKIHTGTEIPGCVGLLHSMIKKSGPDYVENNNFLTEVVTHCNNPLRLKQIIAGLKSALPYDAFAAIINSPSDNGETCLQIATRQNKSKIVKELVLCGANLFIRNSVTQDTILVEALEQGHADVAKIILEEALNNIKKSQQKIEQKESQLEQVTAALQGAINTDNQQEQQRFTNQQQALNQSITESKENIKDLISFYSRSVEQVSKKRGCMSKPKIWTTCGIPMLGFYKQLYESGKINLVQFTDTMKTLYQEAHSHRNDSMQSYIETHDLLTHDEARDALLSDPIFMPEDEDRALEYKIAERNAETESMSESENNYIPEDVVDLYREFRSPRDENMDFLHKHGELISELKNPGNTRHDDLKKAIASVPLSDLGTVSILQECIKHCSSLKKVELLLDRAKQSDKHKASIATTHSLSEAIQTIGVKNTLEARIGQHTLMNILIMHQQYDIASELAKKKTPSMHTHVLAKPDTFGRTPLHVLACLPEEKQLVAMEFINKCIANLDNKSLTHVAKSLSTRDVNGMTPADMFVIHKNCNLLFDIIGHIKLNNIYDLFMSYSPNMENILATVAKTGDCDSFDKLMVMQKKLQSSSMYKKYVDMAYVANSNGDTPISLLLQNTENLEDFKNVMKKHKIDILRNPQVTSSILKAAVTRNGDNVAALDYCISQLQDKKGLQTLHANMPAMITFAMEHGNTVLVTKLNKMKHALDQQLKPNVSIINDSSCKALHKRLAHVIEEEIAPDAPINYDFNTLIAFLENAYQQCNATLTLELIQSNTLLDKVHKNNAQNEKEIGKHLCNAIKAFIEKKDYITAAKIYKYCNDNGISHLVPPGALMPADAIVYHCKTDPRKNGIDYNSLVFAMYLSKKAIEHGMDYKGVIGEILCDADDLEKEYELEDCLNTVHASIPPRFSDFALTATKESGLALPLQQSAAVGRLSPRSMDNLCKATIHGFMQQPADGNSAAAVPINLSQYNLLSTTLNPYLKSALLISPHSCIALASQIARHDLKTIEVSCPSYSNRTVSEQYVKHVFSLMCTLSDTLPCEVFVNVMRNITTGAGHFNHLLALRDTSGNTMLSSLIRHYGPQIFDNIGHVYGVHPHLIRAPGTNHNVLHLCAISSSPTCDNFIKILDGMEKHNPGMAHDYLLEVDSEGKTILHHLAESGLIEHIETFVAADNPPGIAKYLNHKDIHGKTPLESISETFVPTEEEYKTLQKVVKIWSDNNKLKDKKSDEISEHLLGKPKSSGTSKPSKKSQVSLLKTFRNQHVCDAISSELPQLVSTLKFTKKTLDTRMAALESAAQHGNYKDACVLISSTDSYIRFQSSPLPVMRLCCHFDGDYEIQNRAWHALHKSFMDGLPSTKSTLKPLLLSYDDTASRSDVLNMKLGRTMREDLLVRDASLRTAWRGVHEDMTIPCALVKVYGDDGISLLLEDKDCASKIDFRSCISPPPERKTILHEIISTALKDGAEGKQDSPAQLLVKVAEENDASAFFIKDEEGISPLDMLQNVPLEYSEGNNWFKEQQYNIVQKKYIYDSINNLRLRVCNRELTTYGDIKAEINALINRSGNDKNIDRAIVTEIVFPVLTNALLPDIVPESGERKHYRNLVKPLLNDPTIKKMIASNKDAEGNNLLHHLAAEFLNSDPGKNHKKFESALETLKLMTRNMEFKAELKTLLRQKNANGERPLDMMCRTPYAFSLVKEIFETSAHDSMSEDPTIFQKHYLNIHQALAEAIATNSNETVNFLLENYQIATPEWTDSVSGNPYICLAAKHHNYAVIPHLVAKCGCKVNTRNARNETPLHLAANSIVENGVTTESVKTITTLISMGANPALMNNSGVSFFDIIEKRKKHLELSLSNPNNDSTFAAKMRAHNESLSKKRTSLSHLEKRIKMTKIPDQEKILRREISQMKTSIEKEEGYLTEVTDMDRMYMNAHTLKTKKEIINLDKLNRSVVLGIKDYLGDGKHLGEQLVAKHMVVKRGAKKLMMNPSVFALLKDDMLDITVGKDTYCDIDEIFSQYKSKNISAVSIKGDDYSVIVRKTPDGNTVYHPISGETKINVKICVKRDKRYYSFKKISFTVKEDGKILLDDSAITFLNKYDFEDSTIAKKIFIGKTSLEEALRNKKYEKAESHVQDQGAKRVYRPKITDATAVQPGYAKPRFTPVAKSTGYRGGGDDPDNPGFPDSRPPHPGHAHHHARPRSPSPIPSAPLPGATGSGTGGGARPNAHFTSAADMPEPHEVRSKLTDTTHSTAGSQHSDDDSLPPQPPTYIPADPTKLTKEERASLVNEVQALDHNNLAGYFLEIIGKDHENFFKQINGLDNLPQDLHVHDAESLVKLMKTSCVPQLVPVMQNKIVESAEQQLTSQKKQAAQIADVRNQVRGMMSAKGNKNVTEEDIDQFLEEMHSAASHDQTTGAPHAAHQPPPPPTTSVPRTHDTNPGHGHH